MMTPTAYGLALASTWFGVGLVVIALGFSLMYFLDGVKAGVMRLYIPLGILLPGIALILLGAWDAGWNPLLQVLRTLHLLS